MGHLRETESEIRPGAVAWIWALGAVVEKKIRHHARPDIARHALGELSVSAASRSLRAAAQRNLRSM